MEKAAPGPVFGALTGQIEHKTASLLLYALQTASTNLRQTNFKPWVHEVILDPRDAAESALDQTHLWDDETSKKRRKKRSTKSNRKSARRSKKPPRRPAPELSKAYNQAEKATAKGEHSHRSRKESHIATNQGNAACDLHHHFGTVPGME